MGVAGFMVQSVVNETSAYASKEHRFFDIQVLCNSK